MTNELLNKMKEAKTPEELLKIAKENGMTDFTEESAKAYFEAMHKSGELSDDELENAVGGCKVNGHTVVTCDHKCHCGKFEQGFEFDSMENGTYMAFSKRDDNGILRDFWQALTVGDRDEPKCGHCLHLGLTAGRGYCEVD